MIRLRQLLGEDRSLSKSRFSSGLAEDAPWIVIGDKLLRDRGAWAWTWPSGRHGNGAREFALFFYAGEVVTADVNPDYHKIQSASN